MLPLTFLLAGCFAVLISASPVEKTNRRKPEKRQGRDIPCRVAGQTFAHGSIFSYPGYSNCVKYQCNQGSYSVVQPACEGYGQCTPVGSTMRTGHCRSFVCQSEKRGGLNYYTLVPTANDKCEIDGRCVEKNVPFELSNCQTYTCVPTPSGGYDFVPEGFRKCRDELHSRCVDVGTTFAKWVDGHYYSNCICKAGGAYQCNPQ